MDAHFDTLTTKLYQVNSRVSRIAWRQPRMGGFTISPSPSPFLKVFEDENAANGDDDDDEDEDASFSNDDETTS